jgi:hypothetical protein
MVYVGLLRTSRMEKEMDWQRCDILEVIHGVY